MYLLKSGLRLLPLLMLALMLGACDKGGENGPTEFPAPKPPAFHDAFGELWTCIESDDEGSVSGQVSFSRPVSLRRADVLHISLLKLSDDNELELVSTRCMNNLVRIPVDYTITYNPELIDPAARYVLSSTLFTLVDDGDTFLAAYRPDGFLEVINNGVFTNANISLRVP
jgi:uncharacterized lipoprotein YbaY